MYLLMALVSDQMVLTLGIMMALLFAILLGVGWVTKKWSKDSSSFLYGGREAGLLANIVAICTMGFAGMAIVLVSDWTVRFGLVGSIIFNIAYIGIGIILYGFLFATFIRRSGAHTLPEWIEMRFDRATRLLVTITTTIGLLAILANNIASLSTQISAFTGWSNFLSVALTLAIFVIFSYLGGFWAVTITNFIQFIVALIVLPTVVIALVVKYGGNIAWLNFLTSGASGVVTPPIFSFMYPSLLSAFITFGAIFVWGNNYYWSRAAACRTESIARKSYLYAGLIMFFVVMGCLMIIGFYAGANNVLPLSPAYESIVRELPIFLAGIALIGTLSLTLATAANTHFNATTLIVRDVYSRIINPQASQTQMIKISRYIMIVLAILVYAISFIPNGPSFLSAFLIPCFAPSAVLVLFGVFVRRTTKEAAFFGTFITTLVLIVIAMYDLTITFPSFPFNAQYRIYPGVLGFLLCSFLLIIISVFTKAHYYGHKPGLLDKNPPTPEEIIVLDLIRKGYQTMSEITDYLQVDSFMSNSIVESLDHKGLIKRSNLWGADFFSFTLTPLSEPFLPILDQKEQNLMALSVTWEEIILLKAIKDGNGKMIAYRKKRNFSTIKTSVLVAKLIRQNLVTERGLFQRSLTITAKGLQTLEHKS